MNHIAYNINENFVRAVATGDVLQSIVGESATHKHYLVAIADALFALPFANHNVLRHCSSAS